MATYYPSASTQMDVLSSYSEPPLLHGSMMMYHNPTSNGSFTHVSPGSSMNQQNEMMFIPPTGDPMCIQTMNGEQGIGDGDQSLQGLSLSLRTQMSSGVSSGSFQYQYSNLALSADNGVRSIPYDMLGDGHNTIRFGEDSTNSQYEMSMNQYQYEQGCMTGALTKSRYLKPVQELLDEVVSVRDAVKRSGPGPEIKEKNGVKVEDGSKESKGGSMSNRAASETDESVAGSGSSSHELSPAERQELQGKLDKLHSMLDEVDRRYKQYCQQMQIISSSFDMVAGTGASKPYTTLALKTISRHFRCLRDAITGQIQSARKSLGEQDNGLGAIPRLRYVDQQLRQQRALQHFGMMRHAWRPQRGLPENAVTVLRAWLFEHFLHPYPKDSEKIMLARQTGLTRSQVANWFINARVRLWKPMVEEMYKEEFGEAEINTKSPQHTPREKSWGSDNNNNNNNNKDDEMHETTTSIPNSTSSSSSAPPGYHMGPFSSSENHGFYPNGGSHLMVPSTVGEYQIPELGSFSADNNNQVSLALGLRHREGGQSNPTTSEFSYMEQVNQQHKLGNSHILNDFVA